jgi:hypothetical protein
MFRERELSLMEYRIITNYISSHYNKNINEEYYLLGYNAV